LFSLRIYGRGLHFAHDLGHLVRLLCCPGGAGGRRAGARAGLATHIDSLCNGVAQRGTGRILAQNVDGQSLR
jgi:hypothetical protein